MKKYTFILLSLLFVFLNADLYAQRRNPAKNADLAFGRKQYTEAVDRYKSIPQDTAQKMNATESLSKSLNVTDL